MLRLLSSDLASGSVASSAFVISSDAAASTCDLTSTSSTARFCFGHRCGFLRIGMCLLSCCNGFDRRHRHQQTFRRCSDRFAASLPFQSTPAFGTNLLAFEDRIGYPRCKQAYRTQSVVISRNDMIYAFGRAICVNNGDDRNIRGDLLL